MANVMIVDDIPESVEALSIYLTKAGHRVESVSNGREALTAVILRPPDVVVLDLMMPEMDGPTFLEVIRSYMRLRNLPVIVLTGISDGPLVEYARHLGVHAILIKTRVSLEHIRAVVEDVVKGTARPMPVRPPRAAPKDLPHPDN